MRKLVRKFSSLLLRSHQFIERRNQPGKSIKTYRLHYKSSPANKPIVHFNGNFVIGGTSQLIADIIERTSDKYSHQVVVPSIPRPLPYEPLPISAYSVTEMPQLHDYLERNRPALVHIHYWVRSIHRYFDFGIWYDTVFKVCEDLKIPVIQNINVPTQPYSSSSVIHNCFVSHYVKNEFNNTPEIPSSVIYPGSDLAHFSAAGTRQLPKDSIGMVYRLDRDKLDEKAIDVFIAAAQKRNTLRCYIIGGGYFLADFKRKVKEKKLRDQFVFPGYVSYYDLPDWYKKIGLIIAPVHDESFGQVTPFAMGMGIPVAGYDTGALSEILGTSDTLVKYGDVEGLARLILALNEDEEKRRVLSVSNRQRARELFSVENMIGEYKKLYSSYIS